MGKPLRDRTNDFNVNRFGESRQLFQRVCGLPCSVRLMKIDRDKQGLLSGFAGRKRTCRSGPQVDGVIGDVWSVGCCSRKRFS